MKEIDVTELKKELGNHDASHLVIDVRTPDERSVERIRGTVNIPMSRIEEQIDLLKKYDTVYVHCGSGLRSHHVCEELAQRGLTNIVNVKGGVADWDEHGFAVIKHGRLSILRQVRLSAGSLVLIGTLLAIFIHPYFLALPLFISGGLIFSGLTGKCGLAWVLLRMPWNDL